ncbi:MAG TPA: fused MFS/spermidine synthase [Candidatus Krumholzibacteria bacterium]|nr:fused MFS/spermidine synthase [Candidatus Krumholzibacteria bacterium]
MNRFLLPFAVVVCGASVLAIEILGTRVIGPWYGVSLYLWSALITVTLAALAIGYALGGRWADRGPSLARFSRLPLLAGAWTMLVPWLKHPVLAASEPLGIQAAVLVAATVLFFPPLVLLGMVSPYAIRLKAERLEVVGTTAGNLYALSTLASVVAAVLTGFVLIPQLGVTRLLYATGLVLLATGLVVRFGARSGRTALAAVLLLPVFVGGMARTAPVDRPDPARGLLDIASSPYAEIRVVDREGLRYMLIDGSPHTIADPFDWRSDLAYVDVLEIAKLLHPAPGRLLLVGLGGGSVAKSFAADGWQVDAVEIDPVVTRMAHTWFGLREDEAAVHHDDGRRFLATSEPGAYDLVVMDAYGSSSIPFHLVTEEVFALIRSRLAPGGLLAMNVESVGWHSRLVQAVGATAAQVFAQVQVLPIVEPPSELGNVVVLAADWVLEPFGELPSVNDRWGGAYNLVHAWDNRFAAPRGGVPVLTDDRNPVALWSGNVNVASRSVVHRFFGRGGVDR